MVEFEESISTDAARTAAGYQKTGDLLTLPYTETTFINQPYASRIENVNPFNVISWVGSITLDPASDIWKDTNRMPKLIINLEGNYDTFIARNDGKAINTVWNEWQTFGWGKTHGVSVNVETERTGRFSRLTTVTSTITADEHFARDGITIQRFKGLGEMNPDQLWDTTLNPETRTLVKVMLDDEDKALTTCTDLMGDDVSARKRFIDENYKYVQNLDI